MPSDDLRILHWNIHSWRDPSGHANVAAVAALIGETAPDIVSLAEVDEAWGAPGSLRDLAAHCGYSWVFVPAFEFGRDRPDGGGITHLPRKDGQARTDALGRLATLTDGLTEPWLICGDFNTAASSWLGHDRAVVMSPAKLTYPADEPTEPIDYCVASAAFRLDAEVLPGSASDHLPLLISARQTR